MTAATTLDEETDLVSYLRTLHHLSGQQLFSLADMVQVEVAVEAILRILQSNAISLVAYNPNFGGFLKLIKQLYSADGSTLYPFWDESTGRLRPILRSRFSTCRRLIPTLFPAVQTEPVT